MSKDVVKVLLDIVNRIMNEDQVIEHKKTLETTKELLEKTDNIILKTHSTENLIPNDFKVDIRRDGDILWLHVSCISRERITVNMGLKMKAS